MKWIGDEQRQQNRKRMNFPNRSHQNNGGNHQYKQNNSHIIPSLSETLNLNFPGGAKLVKNSIFAGF